MINCLQEMLQSYSSYQMEHNHGRLINKYYLYSKTSKITNELSKITLCKNYHFSI